MFQCVEDLSLSPEALAQLRISAYLSIDEFDGGEARQQGMSRFEHLTHSAMPDLFKENIIVKFVKGRAQW